MTLEELLNGFNHLETCKILKKLVTDGLVEEFVREDNQIGYKVTEKGLNALKNEDWNP